MVKNLFGKNNNKNTSDRNLTLGKSFKKAFSLQAYNLREK
jgi:hypothetical protein